MHAGEFMAMLDERLSDGKRYPTLDEYQRALDEIYARERAREASAVQQMQAQALQGDWQQLFGQQYLQQQLLGQQQSQAQMNLLEALGMANRGPR
jgi:hypothetical protein